MTAAIDTTQPGTCRGCGATVYWRREKSGKASPYDPPRRCDGCAGEGMDPATGDACGTCGGSGMLQTTHFASCPKAGEFRRKAKA